MPIAPHFAAAVDWQIFVEAEDSHAVLSSTRPTRGSARAAMVRAWAGQHAGSRGNAGAPMIIALAPQGVRADAIRWSGGRRAPMKHTILFLAANPIFTDSRALDCEARAIQIELERGGGRDRFELATRWVVEPLDLLRELRKLEPTVVHFSGHGSTGDRAPHGLFFQGPDGRPQRVSTQALEDAFGAAGSSVKLVILTACYSEPQAVALLSHVDCVVGVRGSIHDAATRSFAIGFYGGLAQRESVAAAYRQGCAAMALEGLRDPDRPELKIRPGVDAARLILASAPPVAGGPGWIDGHARVPHQAEAAATTRDEMLAQLSSLLPSQFEAVLFRARIPIEHLSGASAPQATRATEVIRYLEPQDRLAQLAAIVQDVSAVPR
jgi:hypothetical protein